MNGVSLHAGMYWRKPSTWSRLAVSDSIFDQIMYWQF